MTQQKALEILKSGSNVFLTGQPGSGKSYIINKFTDYLSSHDKKVAITASTGIASTHIGGVTIHSWAGMGIGKVFTDEDIDNIVSKWWISRKMNDTHVLIIDEISMIDANFFGNLDRILRKARNKDVSFGGIQVVFVGDFFQLPPIEKGAKFCFTSQSWEDANLKICVLTEQHRQQDMVFLDILTAIRSGSVSPDHIASLKARITPCDHSLFTQLFTHNNEVDNLNYIELKKLQTEQKNYGMSESGIPSLIATLKKNCLSPEVLKLKVDSVVMFTKNNFEEGFVNGTLGKVVKFDEHDGLPVVRVTDGMDIKVDYTDWNIKEHDEIKATINQIPLKLAWAISVHKSQGMSLDGAIIDLSKTFEFGQGYVALSRVRSLDGLFLLGMNTKVFNIHPEVIEKDKYFISESLKLE